MSTISEHFCSPCNRTFPNVKDPSLINHITESHTLKEVANFIALAHRLDKIEASCRMKEFKQLLTIGHGSSVSPDQQTEMNDHESQSPPAAIHDEEMEETEELVSSVLQHRRLDYMNAIMLH